MTSSRKVYLSIVHHFIFTTTSLTHRGSGILKDLSEPIELALIDYATLMMIISDNTATDVLYNKLGEDKIKEIGRASCRERV